MNDEFDSKMKNKCGHNKKKLVSGVGINDADYPVYQIINGKKITCPFHTRWKNMIDRCYSSKLQVRQPTYKGCSVHKDWLTFSNFKKWMEKQPWQGNALDKDLILDGNKIYSEDTCVFVSQEVNNFLLDRAKSRGSLPIGVNLYQGKYRASCNEKGVTVYLGFYDTPYEAHSAWFNYKTKLAKELASQQTDPRVAEALLSRFPETIYESTDSQLLDN